MGQTNYSAGHQAEIIGANYLKEHGYTIHALNWKQPVCEIDIVAQKDRTIYLVEVKYRRTEGQGFGLDYITTQKLQKMKFAAEVWVKDANWKGEYVLSALEVSGTDFTVTNFLPCI